MLLKQIMHFIFLLMRSKIYVFFLLFFLSCALRKSFREVSLPEHFYIKISADCDSIPQSVSFFTALPDEDVLLQIELKTDLLKLASKYKKIKDADLHSFNRHHLYYTGKDTFYIGELIEEIWLKSTDITFKKISSDKFSFKAPKKPGTYPITIYLKTGWEKGKKNNPWSRKMVYLKRNIILFVLYPFDSVENGQLNGYPIGNYPVKDTAGFFFKIHRMDYENPRGFIEVTKGNEDLYISEHFRLGDFTTHRPDTYPKYLILSPELLLKLEYIQKLLGEEHRVKIMSGFRTPWYNYNVSGGARYSQHMYGKAADIYVDSNDDCIMDDLNGDGEIDLEDAAYLASIAEKVEEITCLVGGIGIYDWKRDSTRGPFVHVDVRGFKARW